MTNSLPIEPIEVVVLTDFFLRKDLSCEEHDNLFSDVTVSERDFTGVGFYTYFNPSAVLELEGFGERYLWTDTVGTINGNFNVGFIVYVENGRITCIECHRYTFDSDWPDTVLEIELGTFEVRSL